MFEIDQKKVEEGLTEESVGNASVLQLFYLLGMSSELVLNYEIKDCWNSKFKPWELFVSMVKVRLTYCDITIYKFPGEQGL